MRKENILLYGSAGVGKSTAIISLLKMLDKFPDLEIRWLMAESNAIKGLESGLKIHKIIPKPGQLSYMIAKPDKDSTVSSSQYARNFENNFLGLSNIDALKVSSLGVERKQYSSFLKILKGMAEFKGIDYATKEEISHGDYLKWGSNIIFVIDSLTACVDALVSAVMATRISVTMGDYKDVQNNLMSMVINQITEVSTCSVILLAHPTLGEDPNVKQPKKKEDKILKFYPKTFGQALNGVLPSKFSDTIYAYQDGAGKYLWAGSKSGIFTSVRTLPEEDRLAPDFSKYEFFQ